MVGHIKALPKAREMEDLRAWIDCLFKENAELKTQVADLDEKLKEAETLTAATFKEKVWAQEEREKAVTMARKFHSFVGYPGDVVTKARLYDESMKKSEVVSAPKVLWALIDFSGKVEKLLGELCTLLQYGKQRGGRAIRERLGTGTDDETRTSFPASSDPSRPLNRRSFCSDSATWSARGSTRGSNNTGGAGSNAPGAHSKLTKYR